MFFKFFSYTSSKSKALSYLRDTPADPSIPISFSGELHVKVTMIDGKRSQDRSWRCVWAEIRGNKLKLTIHREGKSSQVSQSFFFTLFLSAKVVQFY